MQPAAAVPRHGQAPLPARAATTLARAVDGVRRFLFGHDVFISYARADALEYAQALADALARNRIAAYVDQLGTPPGPTMPPLLLLRLRLSSMLVLVGSPGAAASAAVAQEVDEFTRRNHRMFVVDVAGALDAAPWYRDRIKGGPARRVTAAELASGTPSGTVIEQILKNVDFGRREDRLRRTMWSTLGVIALILAVGVAGLLFMRAETVAERQRLTRVSGQLAGAQQQTDSVRRLAGQAETRADAANLRAAGADSVRRVAEGAARSASLAAATALDSVEARRRMARALQLANQATAALNDSGPGLARGLLLAVESLKEDWTVDGAAAWLRAMALLSPRLGGVQADTGAITALAASADGTLLASSDAGGGVRVWSVRHEGGRTTLAPRFPGIASLPQVINGRVGRLAFSRDGRLLGASYGNRLVIWRVSGVPSRAVLHVARQQIYDFTFSPDGRLVAVAEAYWVEVLETEHGSGERLRRPNEAATNVAFSPDGTLLAVGGGVGVQLWTVETRQLAASHRLPGMAAEGLRFTGDGAGLAWGEKRLGIWRGNGVVTLTPERVSPRIEGARTVLGTGTYAGERFGGGVSLRDTTGSEVSRIVAPASAVAVAARWVAVGGYDGSITLFPGTPRQESMRVSLGTRPGAAGADFSADGRWLAATGPGGTRVLEVGTWREVMRDAHGGWRARFSAGRLLVATDSVVRSISPAGWHAVYGLAGRVDSISRDGRWLMEARQRFCGHVLQAGARIWSAATGREEAWRRPGCAYENVSAGSGGQTALLADTLHWVPFEPPARSADGRWEASWEGPSVQLVDAASGRVVAGFVAQENGMWQLAFSPDGNWLATAGVDGTVRVWRLGPAAAMVAEACGRLRRNLTFPEWQQAFGSRPYRRTCPALPDPPPVSSEPV